MSQPAPRVSAHHRASTFRRLLLGVATLSVGVAFTGCGSSAPASTTPAHPETLRVPAQYPTIQAAVDHAHPGDLVLISPGTYHEEVTVRVPRLDIRGLDRNTVILDGGNTMANGIEASADGDVVEDLTARRYAVNGVLFTKAGYSGDSDHPTSQLPLLTGYRASYITAYDNGLYGVYAFAATAGQVDHVEADGQPDSGIYIGQCSPCDAVVTDSEGRGNRTGFEAANASGGLSVVDSTWTGNRAGITVESSTEEALAPQRGALVAGNLVTDNDNPQTPTQDLDTDVFGYGIVIGGGSGDTVTANRVTGNPTVGVIVTPAAGYAQGQNTIKGNVVMSNGVDLALVPASGTSLPVAGTCFAGNTFTSSQPTGLQSLVPCAGGGQPTLSVGPLVQPTPPQGVDYSTLPAPPAQPSMPDAATAPAAAATGLGAAPDPGTVTVPAG